MMGSDGEVRCHCVPLHAVVCNCVLCVTHLRILDNGVTVHPPHGFLCVKLQARFSDTRLQFRISFPTQVSTHNDGQRWRGALQLRATVCCRV